MAPARRGNHVQRPTGHQHSRPRAGGGGSRGARALRGAGTISNRPGSFHRTAGPRLTPISAGALLSQPPGYNATHPPGIPPAGPRPDPETGHHAQYVPRDCEPPGPPSRQAAHQPWPIRSRHQLDRARTNPPISDAGRICPVRQVAEPPAGPNPADGHDSPGWPAMVQTRTGRPRKVRGRPGSAWCGVTRAGRRRPPPGPPTGRSGTGRPKPAPSAPPWSAACPASRGRS